METSKFYNWVKEYGWRHLIALIFVTFAVYPILFVATNSIADFANLPAHCIDLVFEMRPECDETEKLDFFHFLY